MPKKQPRIPKGGGTPRNPKRNRKTKKKSQQAPSKIRKYARMLADPCHAPLVGGIFGDNTTTIHRETINYNIQLNQHGYLVVFPEYCSNFDHADPETFFLAENGEVVRESQTWDSIFFNNDEDTAPVSFAPNSLHLGAVNAAARRWYKSPDSYDRAGGAEERRCVSACLTVTYAGRLEDRAGLMVPIRDVSPGELLGESPDSVSDGVFRPPGEIFRHSSVISPTQPVLEVKWRGNGSTGTQKWHTPSQGVFALRKPKDGDVPVSFGFANESKEDDSIRGMGFAFNLPNPTEFIVSYTKVFETRPARIAQHRNLSMTGLSTHQSFGGKSYYSQAREVLNRWNPDWDLVQSFLWKSAQAYSRFSSGNAKMLKNEL